MKSRERRMIHRGIDGELGREETRVLRRKLKQDGRVREEYEKLRYVTESTRKIRRVEVPEGFSGRVVRRIRRGT